MVDFLDIDVKLINKFKEGDAKSFEELMDRYQKLVINTAYRLIGDRVEAEDIAQEVFLKVYNCVQSYKPQAKFSTWLLKITKNLCLNKLREKKRHPLISFDMPIKTREGKLPREFPDGNQYRPGVSLEKKEIQNLVKEAVDSLPARQKMAVILAKYEGLPYREIARVMGCSVTAVKLCLHRAKTALKDKLAPYF